MKVLVIPDVHLKPEMFQRASALLKQGIAEKAVCLMDIPDDWNEQFNVDLYAKTYDAAIAFAKEFPDTCWCYGNHDLSYIWNRLETGYSSMAASTVQRKLIELQQVLTEDNPVRYVHRIDNVLFCHGGITSEFVKELSGQVNYDDVTAVVDIINRLGEYEMWNDASPIWYRPQYYKGSMYKPRKLLQVVGHTPMEEITRKGNIISCDVFSTYSNGKPIGTREYLLLDTQTWEYKGIQ